MNRKEIRFSGFGGQGIVLSGIITGKAAAVYGGLNSVQVQSYGVEARGGASRSEVVIDEKEVDSPVVTRPDIFVVMSQPAYDKYIKDVKKGGEVYFDDGLVKKQDRKGIMHYGVPATKTAVDKLNKKLVANVVMLGALVAKTGLFSKKDMEESIKNTVKKDTVNINLRAFEEGRKLGKGVKG